MKEHKIIKFLMPVFAAAYIIGVTYGIGEVLKLVPPVQWKKISAELGLYLFITLLTYFAVKKLFPKLFPGAESYQFKPVSSSTAAMLACITPLTAALLWRLNIYLYTLKGNKLVPSTEKEEFPEFLILAFFSVLIHPIFEEICFRYMALSPQKTPLQKITALVLSSMIFGCLHWHNPYTALTTVINGILFGTVFLLTKNICHSVLLHIFYNATVASVGIITTLGVDIVVDKNISAPYFDNNWLLGMSVLALIGIIIMLKEKITIYKAKKQGNAE